MFRIITIISTFITILSSSCSRPEVDSYSFLNNVDTVRIFYNVLDSSFKPISIPLDIRHSNLFKQVFKSEPENSNCNHIETIKFYSKGKEVFETGLVNGDNKNQFLIINNNGKNECHRLTYQLGMFLSESLK